MATKKSESGVRGRSGAVKAGATDKQAEVSPASAGGPVAISLRLPRAMHEELRRLAFEDRTPMHGMILDGVRLFLRGKGIFVE
jgi:hypothetical protein